MTLIELGRDDRFVAPLIARPTPHGPQLRVYAEVRYKDGDGHFRTFAAFGWTRDEAYEICEVEAAAFVLACSVVP